MIRASIDRAIPRPIEAVFDRLIDIDHYGDWMPRSGLFRDSHRSGEGPVGPGTRYVDETILGRFMGQIDEHERPTRVSFHQVLSRRGRPVFISRPAYTLERTSGGTATLVHHRAEGELRGAYRLFEPVARLIARRERRRTVEALARSFGGESG